LNVLGADAAPASWRMGARLRILAVAVAALAVASFALACFVPVYTDEIVWKIIQGRVIADGGRELSLTLEPTCGPYSFAVPALIYPFRWLDGVLYGALASPGDVRAAGVGAALLWLLLAFVFVRDLTRGTIGGAAAAAGLVALATLGIMPFLLVISRPEQILLLGITVFLYPLLKPEGREAPPLARSLAAATGGTALVCYVLAAHPRAFLALPLMFAFLYRVARRKAVFAGAGAAVAAFAVVSYRDWTQRWACAGDSAIAHLYFKINITSALKDGQLVAYLRDVLASLLRTRGWYINEFALRSKYSSDLLPGMKHPLLGWAVELVFALVLLAGAVSFLVLVWNFRRERGQRLAVIGLGTVWVFYLASVGSRILKFDYEAELMEPVMAMAALGSLWLAAPHLMRRFRRERVESAAKAGFATVLALSAATQIWLLVNYVPHALGAWSRPGYAEGQRFSVTSVGYGGLSRQILATARLCGIDPAARPRHLVVDELTYYALRQTVEPFVMTYFDEHGWRQGLGDPRPIWRAYHAAGMVIGCERVQTAFADRVTRNGAFCCLPSFAGR
jgi:hypothetical protein